VAANVLGALPVDCEVSAIAYLGEFERPRLSGLRLTVRARRRGPACSIALRAETAAGRPLSAWRRTAFVAGAPRTRTLRLTRPASGLAVIALHVRPRRCRGYGYRAQGRRLAFARAAA
jgi:hypothetical protein